MRRIATLLFSLALSSIFSISGTALAASGSQVVVRPLAACPDGSFCLFENGSGGGQIYTTPGGQDSTLHNNLCQGCISSKHPNSNNTWGDVASSYQNRSGKQYCLYKDTNFNGILVIAVAGDTAIHGFSSSVNDEISSLRPC